jgi:hypothetical protein
MAATRMRTGRFRYQARGVRADLRDWSDPSWAGEEGFTVALQRGDDVVATTVTGADGAFALQVPLEPTADDRLTVIPAVFRRGELMLAMGDPGFAPSRDERSVSRALPAERRVWAWSWDLAMISAEGRIDLDLPLAQGSGVAEAFAWSRIAWRAAEQAQGRVGKTLITWVSPGTSWTCGACDAGVEHRLNRTRFASQAWLDGGPDEGFWSSSVNVHEMGHWWMDSYSRAPGEGGSHTGDCGSPSAPIPATPTTRGARPHGSPRWTAPPSSTTPAAWRSARRCASASRPSPRARGSRVCARRSRARGGCPVRTPR